jgi:hypothetical protein
MNIWRTIVFILVSAFVCECTKSSSDGNVNYDYPDEDVNNNNGNNEQPNQQPNDLLETVKGVAFAIGNPSVASAIEVLKSLKTEISSSIGPMQHQPGKFDYMDNIMEHGYGDIAVENIGNLLNLLLDETTIADNDTSFKEVIVLSVKRMALQIPDPNSEFKTQKFRIVYQNELGTMFMIMLSLKPSKSVKGAVRYVFNIISSKFKPSKSFYILTNSKCNIIKCKRTDSIVYMPGTITIGDITDIINMNINAILVFVEQSVLLDT